MGKKGDKKDAPAEEAGEEAFVRGGGSGLAPIEKRKLEQASLYNGCLCATRMWDGRL